MNDQEIHQLQVQQAKGEATARAWEEHVKPFVDAKEEELFDAFKRMPTTNKDDLLTIKMQANVLAMLEDHFKSLIDTGILARKQLESLEEDKE